jgi:hypothetical protein
MRASRKYGQGGSASYLEMKKRNGFAFHSARISTVLGIARQNFLGGIKA